MQKFVQMAPQKYIAYPDFNWFAKHFVFQCHVGFITNPWICMKKRGAARPIIIEEKEDGSRKYNCMATAHWETQYVCASGIKVYLIFCFFNLFVLKVPLKSTDSTAGSTPYRCTPLRGKCHYSATTECCRPHWSLPNAKKPHFLTEKTLLRV